MDISEDPLYQLLHELPVPPALAPVLPRTRSRSRSCTPPVSSRLLQAIRDDIKLSDSEHEDDESVACQSLPDPAAELISMRDCAMWAAAMHQLPINFELMHGQNCAWSLRKLNAELAEVHELGAFYIGATVNPVRRWMGDRDSLRGDKPMRGHGRDGWSIMFMLTLTTDGRKLEQALIKYGKSNWPDLCTNIATDSRGQCPGANWIYVCYKYIC